MKKYLFVILIGLIFFSATPGTAYSEQVSIKDKEGEWTFGIEGLPLSAYLNVTNINTDIWVDFPPIPGIPHFLGCGINLSGLWMSAQFNGFGAFAEYKYKSGLGINSSVDYFYDERQSLGPGTSVLRTYDNRKYWMAVPKVVVCYYPVKYFSVGFGYALIFWNYKQWVTANFEPLNVISGNIDYSSINGLPIFSLGFHLPIEELFSAGDFILSLEGVGSLEREKMRDLSNANQILNGTEGRDPQIIFAALNLKLGFKFK